jgi:ribosomal protein L20
MTRVTRGFVAKKRRKKVLQLASGFTGANNRLYRTAQQRVLRALSTAYRDRRLMKRTIRSVWIRRINCFLRDYKTAEWRDRAKCSSENPKNLRSRGRSQALLLAGSTSKIEGTTQPASRSASRPHEGEAARNLAATRAGLSYSLFISKLKQFNILLNRKILSQLAILDSSSLQKIIQKIN